MFGVKRTCRGVRRQMHAFLDGEQTQAETGAFEAHLASCGACRRAFERLERSEAALRAHFEETASGAVAPDRFWADLSGRLAAAERRPRPAAARLRDLLPVPAWRVLAPVAVVVALAVWGIREYREEGASAGAQEVQRELAEIRASILDMEAELEQVQHWR